MKRILIAIVAILVTTSVNANENVAKGIATFMIYNAKCEKLPRVFEQMSMQVVMQINISPDALRAINQKALDEYQQAGPASWCQMMKPVVENAVRNYR